MCIILQHLAARAASVASLCVLFHCRRARSSRSLPGSAKRRRAARPGAEVLIVDKANQDLRYSGSAVDKHAEISHAR